MMNKKMSTEDVICKAESSVLHLSCKHGAGTGFVVSPEGHIITSNHVVESDDVEVTLPNGKTWHISVLARDVYLDLAMLKIDNFDMPGMIFADPVNILIGQKVFALGHPLGFDFTVSQGIISNRDRTINGVSYIQTDVAMNPGNSGGPIINENCEVVGIANRMISLQIAQGLGFATAIRHVFSFAAKLRVNLKRDDTLVNLQESP